MKQETITEYAATIQLVSGTFALGYGSSYALTVFWLAVPMAWVVDGLFELSLFVVPVGIATGLTWATFADEPAEHRQNYSLAYGALPALAGTLFYYEWFTACVIVLAATYLQFLREREVELDGDPANA